MRVYPFDTKKIGSYLRQCNTQTYSCTVELVWATKC